jgi:regulator of protease activity HflC (stomatin/prohibitin superfamily)
MEEKSIFKKIIFGVIFGVIFGIIFIWLFFNTWTTVPAGNVGVKILFGEVQDGYYNEGFHFVNPLIDISLLDAKQKTIKDTIGVPSMDQLITTFEISVQYRLIKEQAPNMLKETGTPDQVINVHMIPLFRSKMREISKSVETAEMFYTQSVQQRIQEELLSSLSSLANKGISVKEVLIRDVKLPTVITDAVIRKKNAAQEAEKAKEELKKFKIDQEKKEAGALATKKAALIEANKKREVMLIASNAKLDAARIDAKATLVKAKAEAEAKTKIVNAITLEGYIKLESMKAIKYLQNGNHMIIMDPKSINPLPFLNLTK